MSEKPHVDPLEETRAESIRPGKLLAGAPIGGYELSHVLGEGGMGVVWAAHDPLLDRTIAIKVLKSRDVHDAMRTRLLREAQAMAQIKHPNVLTVHRVGTEGDRDYIAMELVDGGPLDHWLAFGPPEHEVMDALLAAGRGLAAAHAVGLVHRDFKPNNILRSKDGHVLVTDFGLARSLGDDWTSPVSATGSLDPDAKDSQTRAKDNVLSSPLTKTGALIGTPAYMAPEQFAGAEPDPRTDQFAYCVTAWQALTGARPFHGRTIDELRQAATSGVGGVVAQLSKPMRAVLTRGLDPDPAKRWPDMQTLLREIERAGKPPKSKLPWIIGGGIVAAAGIVAILVLAGSKAAFPACEPAETAWADAWSAKALPDEHAWIGSVLDDHKRRWFATYEQTCKTIVDVPPQGRLDCLRAARSRIAAVGELVTKHPETRIAIDPWLYLAPPEACAGRPASLAAFPEDRERILALLARAITLPNSDRLAAEATATGWAPLEPMVVVTAGLRRIREGAIAEGRALLEKVADGSDPRLVARARLGLLSASMKELAHPDAGKGDALHEEIAKALTYARSAVKAVDDPTLVGILAFLEAEIVADQTERATKKTTYANALELATRARVSLEAANDPKRAASAAALYADIQLRRGDPSALSEAEFVARSAAAALERAKRPPLAPLDQLLGQIAFARGELISAHRWFDRAGAPPEAGGEAWVEGVVLKADGKPLMNATVIAWTSELHGDAVRAITDRQTLRGEVVETGAEGKFKIRVRPGSALVAESPGGALRSLPIAVRAGAKDLSLRLGTTTELVGKLDTDGPGPHVYARFSVGQAAWLIETPLLAGNGFQFTNLPQGLWEIGAIGPSGTGTRRARGGSVTLSEGPKLVFNGVAWVTGTPIDVVVRGTVSPAATVWVGDAKSMMSLTTRAELEAYEGTALEIASSPLLQIGSRYTDAGRHFYVAGARHAVLVGDFRDAAACVAPSDVPTTKLTCKKIERDAKAIAIDL